jgi:hypothetical protein
MLDDSHTCGSGCKMTGFTDISSSMDWGEESEIM